MTQITSCPICKKWFEMGNTFPLFTPYPKCEDTKVVYLIKDISVPHSISTIFKDGDTRTDALNYVNSKTNLRLHYVEIRLNKFKECYGGIHTLVSVYLHK